MFSPCDKHDQPAMTRAARSPWTNGRGRRAQWAALTAATIEASETIRERAKIRAKRTRGIGATKERGRAARRRRRDALSTLHPEKDRKRRDRRAPRPQRLRRRPPGISERSRGGRPAKAPQNIAGERQDAGLRPAVRATSSRRCCRSPPSERRLRRLGRQYAGRDRSDDVGNEEEDDRTHSETSRPAAGSRFRAGRRTSSETQPITSENSAIISTPTA